MALSSSRYCDTNRANRAAEMTGAATPLATASLTVQRPSPESAATAAMSLRSPLSRSAFTIRSSSHDRTTLPCCQEPTAASTSMSSFEPSKMA